MLLIERVLNEAKILESNRDKLPSGVLCRVKYPICNIDELNANKRRYGRPLWERVKSDPCISEQMSNRALFGHAEHPAQTQSDLQLTSHVIFEMEISDDGRVYQTMDIVDTPMGRIVDTLLRANCKVGVSTRAEGELQEAKDDDGNTFYDVIAEKYKYKTTDFTADPSTYGAIPLEIKRGVIESVGQELKNQRNRIEERKLAYQVIESMSCKNSNHNGSCSCGPEGCGACKMLHEAAISVNTDAIGAKQVMISGDVQDAQVTGDVKTVSVATGNTTITVTAKDENAIQPVDMPPAGEEEEYDMDGELGEEPTSSEVNAKEPEVDELSGNGEDDEDNIGESKVNEDAGPYYPNKDDYDSQFWKGNYKVLVTAQGIEFIVNADNEQDAIDYVIDYCEENLPGLIMSDEEEQELQTEGHLDDYIQGGNHSKYLNTYDVHISRVKGPDVAECKVEDEAEHWILKQRNRDEAIDHLVEEFKIDRDQAIEAYKQAQEKLRQEMKGAGFEKEEWPEVLGERVKTYRLTLNEWRNLDPRGLDFVSKIVEDKEFKACVKGGGRVRTVSGGKGGAKKLASHGLKKNEYVKYCYSDGKSYRGEVKTKKNESRINEGVEIYSDGEYEEKLGSGEIEPDNVTKTFRLPENFDLEKFIEVVGQPTRSTEWGDLEWVGEIDGNQFILSLWEGKEEFRIGAIGHETVKAVEDWLEREFQWDLPAATNVPNESITLKLVNDLRIKEAITREESIRLIEEIGRLGKSELQARMLVKRHTSQVESVTSELDATRSKLEEKAKAASDAETQCNELKEQNQRDRDHYEKKITEMSERIQEQMNLVKEAKALVESTRQECERQSNERINESTKQLIRQYSANQLSVFGSVHDNVRALLEDCMTIQEVDQVINEYRESRRRGALHQPIKETVVVKPKDQPTTGTGRTKSLIGIVFEGMNGK